MVKIWLRTSESGRACDSGRTRVGASTADEEYPSAGGVKAEGPFLAVIETLQVKVVNAGGKADARVRVLAMYPLDVIRKVIIDE